MAALPRETGMPTIKCSSCGRQVEISMMGEHVCQGAPAPGLSVANDSLAAFMPFSAGIHDKISPLPPVDTITANRSFMRQGQLTPASLSSGSQTVSPKTPTARLAPARADDHGSTPPEQSRHPSGYGALGGHAAGQDADQTQPSSSPQSQGPSLMTRMNSIAPGPFEAGRGGGTKNNSPVDGANGFARRPSFNDRPGTSASSTSTGSGGGLAPPMPRKNGYGGFGPPQRPEDEFSAPSFAAVNRSGTFPGPSPSVEAPARTPSAPGVRPERPRRPSEAASMRAPLPDEKLRRPSAASTRDTSRPPPPRKSLLRPPTAGRDGANPPGVNLAEEFGIGNPYHSPSESMSSSYSGTSSHVSQPSFQTSPARSANSRTGRNPSDTSSFDNLMSDLQSSMDELKPKELPSALPPLSSNSLSPRLPLSDSRFDPAIQGPRSPLGSPGGWDPAVQDGRGPLSPALPSPGLPPAASGRRPSQARGNCRGCGNAITGKSISSADGRLTGRYHKTCFVCTTCREPFQTSEFYVHGDRPYCKQHYHRVNGSLCGSCNDGIEGQYLEDEKMKKYHVQCFRCADCGLVLRDGYFDVNGRSYCEKDAWRRLQPPQPYMGGMPPRPGSNLGPGGGLPPRPGGPGGPGRGPMMRPPYGPPGGSRLAPMPRMEKRMTRLGMM